MFTWRLSSGQRLVVLVSWYVHCYNAVLLYWRMGGDEAVTVCFSFRFWHTELNREAKREEERVVIHRRIMMLLILLGNIYLPIFWPLQGGQRSWRQPLWSWKGSGVLLINKEGNWIWLLWFKEKILWKILWLLVNSFACTRPQTSATD